MSLLPSLIILSWSNSFSLTPVFFVTQWSWILIRKIMGLIPAKLTAPRSLKICSRSARSLWKMRWYFPYSPFLKQAIVQNSISFFVIPNPLCWIYHLPKNPSKHIIPLFANQPPFYLFNLIPVAKTTYLDLIKLLFGFLVGVSRTPWFRYNIIIFFGFDSVVI